jgi:hypothetical protein
MHVTTAMKGHRKMYDDLYKIVSASNLMDVHLSGEEIIYVTDDKYFQNGRKKKIQEENVKHGKESGYDYYR